MMDQVVQRRPTDWYLGRVFKAGQPLVDAGLASGYYRVKAINPDGSWNTDYLGTTMPHGEPVYLHDGRRDLKAIPSTVVPAWWKWILWAAIYLVAAGFMYSVSGGDGGAFWPLILLPVACQPFYDWYMAIEPVRGTKTSLVIFGIEGALAVKQRHDRAEMAAMSERLGR